MGDNRSSGGSDLDTLLKRCDPMYAHRAKASQSQVWKNKTLYPRDELMSVVNRRLRHGISANGVTLPGEARLLFAGKSNQTVHHSDRG